MEQSSKPGLINVPNRYSQLPGFRVHRGTMKDDRDDKVKPGTKQDATPRYRFAIVVWVTAFPLVTLLQYLLKDFIEGWEIYEKTLFISLIEVPILVFILIPLMQRLLGDWLKHGWENS